MGGTRRFISGEGFSVWRSGGKAKMNVGSY